MERNTKNLGCWLITKGETSLLKIQKILFFLRVEELKNKNTFNSFFKEKDNFQAWIYGPVNVESFQYLQSWFNKTNESEQYFLEENEVKEIDAIYEKYYEKYCSMSPNELVNLSHKNLSWINARKGFGANEICKNFLKEDDSFIKFEE